MKQTKRYNLKKVNLGILLNVVMTMSLVAGCDQKTNSSLYFSTSFSPNYLINSDDLQYDANDDKFNIENTTAGSCLEGKTFYWLGDSVIYGSSTNGVAVSEFLSKTTGCLCVKDAISGTKLQCIDNDPMSFLSRVVSGTTLKPDKEIDGFFIQISVNDVSSLNYTNMGDLSSQTNINLNSFDVSTTLGSLEYIVNYIENTWDCPIFLCTQSFYENSGSRQAGFFNPDWYTVLLDKVYSLIDKYDTFSNFDVEIINLFYDDAFNNAVSDLYFDWAMDDSIHPKLAGYRNWWTPYFISYLEAFFANAVD